MKWNVFRFLGGNGCFIAATFTSNASRDDVVCRTSGMILRGMGSERESFIFDRNPEDRLFVINWDHNCFMVDVNGVKGFSWLPSGPVELDVEVSTLDEGSEEVESIVVGIHVDEDDSIVSAQGEDGRGCYNPPYFSPPLYPLVSTPKPPTKPLPVLPPLPPSNPPKDATMHLPTLIQPQPPVEPLVPIPWNIHQREYSSMEMYQEPPPVENVLEDPDSPMEDAPPLEPESVTHYEPDVPGGQTHTLSPEESPIEPWQAYLTQPGSPISRKHSLSPTSPSSAPIRQRTSREGSYQSITPAASSPIASTLPQSQGHQSTSSEESADNPSSTHSSAEDVDSDMALNWVTIRSDYHKG